MTGFRPGFSASTEAALLASDARIVITGASGWLGSATIELLHDSLGDQLLDRLHLFGSSARTLTLCDGLVVEQRPLADLARLDRAPTIVLHLAFLTKDKVAGMDADAYRAANAALSDTVLSALDPIGADAIFVASSGAARSADDADANAALRLYGSLKKRDEALFERWALNGGRSAVIARVFNLSGRYINKHGDYALAAFVLDALAGRPIAVRAPHRVVRGYVAVRELISLVLGLLLTAPGIHRFDTGGEAMELGDVASAVAEVLHAASVERAPITDDRLDRYVGDPAEYDRLRGLLSVDAVPFRDQISETADFLVGSAPARG